MPRTYLPLSDRRILWLFRHGYYHITNIDSDTPEIYSVKYHSNKHHFVTTRRKPLRIRHQLCHRGYRHVRLYYKGRRSSTALHKLVWMLSNGRVVPANHEVHHIKSKKSLGRCCDGITNLELLNTKEHSAKHLEEFLNPSSTSVSDYPSTWDDI